MTTAVGKVNIDYLEQPKGIVHEFVIYLASDTNRIGYGSALGFYRKDIMERSAEEFLDLKAADTEEIEQVYSWVESLPWNESGYLAFVFNW